LASYTTFLKDRLGYILFIAGILYFLFLIRSDVIQNGSLNGEKRALAGRLDTEIKLKESLKLRYNSLSGGQMVEQLSREKLGYVKEGESAYKVLFLGGNK
jgi:cell division protein FtsB